MELVALTAYNTQDYQLTVSLAAWAAAGYDLASCSFVKTARLDVLKPPTLLWSSAPVVGSQGSIVLVEDDENENALTALRFAMPASLVRARIGAPCTLSYDVQLVTSEAVPRTRLVFGGSLNFLQGQGNPP